jgi:hypothetical protein
MTMGTTLQLAATKSPIMMRENAQHVALPSEGETTLLPDQARMWRMQQSSRNRGNGFRDRVPLRVSLQLRPGPVR